MKAKQIETSKCYLALALEGGVSYHLHFTRDSKTAEEWKLK